MKKKHIFNGKLIAVSLSEELPKEFKSCYEQPSRKKQDPALMMNYLSEIQQELKSVHQDILQLQKTHKNEAELPEEKKINPREIVSNEELSLFFGDEIEESMPENIAEHEPSSNTSWIKGVVNDNNSDSQELESSVGSYKPWHQNSSQ